MKDPTKLDNASRSKRSREYDSVFGDDEYAASNEKRRNQTKTYWDKLSTPNPRYMRKDAEEPPRKKTRVCISNKFCPPRIDQLATPTTPRMEGVLSEYHNTLEPERVVRIVKLIHTNQDPKPIRHTVKRRKKKRPSRRLKKRNKEKSENEWLNEQTDVSAQLIMDSLQTRVAYTPNYKQVILSLGLMKTLKSKNQNCLFRENLLKTSEQLAIIADREWEPYQHIEDVETESEEELKPEELKKRVVYRMESTASMTSISEDESEEEYETPSSEVDEEDHLYLGKDVHGKHSGPETIYEDTEEDERPVTITEESEEEEEEELLQQGTEFEDIKEEPSAEEDEEAKKDIKQEPETESEQIKEEDQEFTDIKPEEADIKEELAEVKEEEADIKEELAEVKLEEASIKEELAEVKNEDASIKEEPAEVKKEEADIKEELAEVKNEEASIKEELVEVKKEEANIKEEVVDEISIKEIPVENTAEAALILSEPSEGKEIEPAVGEETLKKAESVKEANPVESAAITKENKVEEAEKLVDIPKENENASVKGVDEETTKIQQEKVKSSSLKEEEEVVSVTEEAAAVKEKKASVKEEEAAVKEKKASVKEEEAAVKEEKKASVKEEEAAVKEKKASVKEEEAAVKEEEAAVKEKKASVKEEEAAVKEEKASVKEEKASVKEKEIAEEEEKLEAKEEKKEKVEPTAEVQATSILLPAAGDEQKEAAISSEKEISSERIVSIRTASGDIVEATITVGKDGEEMIELEDSQGKRTSVPLKSLSIEGGLFVQPEDMHVIEEAKPPVLQLLSEHSEGTASYVAYRVYSTWLEEFGHNIQTYSSCLKSFSDIVAKSQLDRNTNASRHSPAVREVLLNWSSYLAETMRFESAMKDYFKGKPVTRCNKCSDNYNMYNLPSEEEHPLPVELRAALAHTAHWKQLLANAEKQSILFTALVESDSFTSSFITVDVQDVASVISSDSAYIVEEVDDD